MKRIILFAFILVFFTLAGCSGGENKVVLPTDAQGRYTGFFNVPESCTIDEAGDFGYYAMLELRDVKNRGVWDRFISRAQSGRDAYVRIAQFYPDEENKPYYLDLYHLNGSYYLFDTSAGEQKPEPYPFLLTLRGTDGIPPKENSAVVLSEDDTLTFTDVMKSLYSSTADENAKRLRIVLFRTPAEFK